MLCGFLLMSLPSWAKSQSSTNSSTVSVDGKCVELNRILADSVYGFKNSNLIKDPFSDFTSFSKLTYSDFDQPANVMTVEVTDFYGKPLKNAIVFWINKVMKQMDAAKRQYYSAFLDLKNCLPNAQFDNKVPSGFLAYSKFLVKDEKNNAEITVWLDLKMVSKDKFYLDLNVVSNKTLPLNNSKTVVTSTTQATINDPRCVDLQKIVENSSNGFKNVRFNERQNSTGDYSYQTNLPFWEFSKPSVIIGKTALYNGTNVKAAFFLGTKILNKINEVDSEFLKGIQQTQRCYTDSKNDSTIPAGFLKYQKFLVPDKSNGGEVTITLSVLKMTETQYFYTITVVSNKSTSEIGAAQNSNLPNNSTSQTNIPAKTIDVCQFIKILSESAKNDFASLKGEEIAKSQNDEFSVEKKYKAKISFSEFEYPQIQKSIYKDTVNYYTAKMTFEESQMVPFVMKQTVDQIKRCTNLKLKPDADSSKELYDFRLEDQTHSDGFKYVYLVRLQWGEPAVSNSRNLYFKLIPLRQN